MIDLCTQHVHEEPLARCWEKCDDRNSRAKPENHMCQHGPENQQGVAQSVIYNIAEIKLKVIQFCKFKSNRKMETLSFSTQSKFKLRKQIN